MVKRSPRDDLLSTRIENAYIHRIKRFVLFQNKRHPVDMGELEIRRFCYNSLEQNMCFLQFKIKRS
jgi:hypothetical protein